MLSPGGRRDLVFDQRIHGCRIGHPQKRLGQTHKGHTFVGGQAVLGQKDLHQARTCIIPDGMDQPGCPIGRRPTLGHVRRGGT